MNYNSYKSIWKLTWPLIISGLGQTLINVTDTLFLGRLGETALGASAISGLFYATFLMIAFGLGNGTQILIAKYSGEGNNHKITSLLNQANLLQIVLAFALTVVCYLFYPALLKVMVSSSAIQQASSEFLKFRFLGFFAVFLLTSLRSFYGGIGVTRVITYITVLMALLNVVFNYLLVYGEFGFPKLGISGSALASVIAEYVSLIYAIVYTFWFNSKNNYNLYFNIRFDFSIIKTIWSLSYPIILQYMISLISWFLFFLIVEKLSSEYLAVSNLVRNVYMIIMAPILAFTQSTSTVISHHIGKKDYHILKSLLFKIILMSFVITLIISSVSLVFPKFLIGLFTNQTYLIEHSIGTMYVVCLALVLFSISVPVLSALSATGKTKISFIIEFITMFLYVGFAAYFGLILKLSLPFIWSVEIIYFTFIGISAYFYFNQFVKNSLLNND